MQQQFLRTWTFTHSGTTVLVSETNTPNTVVIEIPDGRATLSREQSEALADLIRPQSYTSSDKIHWKDNP